MIAHIRYKSCVAGLYGLFALSRFIKQNTKTKHRYQNVTQNYQNTIAFRKYMVEFLLQGNKIIDMEIKEMAISYRVTNQGAYELSCLVIEPGTPFKFYEHSQYFGYTKKEATRLFREHLANKGMKIVRN